MILKKSLCYINQQFYLFTDENNIVASLVIA